ncbi:hypothetical protein CAOG_010099 [Capsaspora owczarzaki ATCC 30864]|uniref:Uncharacterized protein n=1 Tax=Capsaspora owczarzaki (strain ATCC 30864) TaxID=595528 RepID=A0A0D2WX41_CAPO3|nr:hypothetical protein CAOG_010099 [Capsaspora owczarzaki ATCC 30864]
MARYASLNRKCSCSISARARSTRRRVTLSCHSAIVCSSCSCWVLSSSDTEAALARHCNGGWLSSRLNAVRQTSCSSSSSGIMQQDEGRIGADRACQDDEQQPTETELIATDGLKRDMLEQLMTRWRALNLKPNSKGSWPSSTQVRV